MVCENVVNHSHSYRCRFRVMFWQDASPAHIYIFMFVKEVWYILGVFTMFVCFLEISWHPKQTPRQVPTVIFDPKCSGWIFNRLLYFKVRSKDDDLNFLQWHVVRAHEYAWLVTWLLSIVFICISWLHTSSIMWY